MSEDIAVRDPEGLPEDYPGRVAVFPAGTTHLVFAMFGVQRPADVPDPGFVDALRGLLTGAGAPVKTELFRQTGPEQAGQANDIVAAYWLSPGGMQGWWERPDVQTWWNALPTDPSSPVGYWREVIHTPVDRFNYATGFPYPTGSGEFLGLAPSNKFGYWGAYRDRIPASATDAFESPLEILPAETLKETRGRRLRVVAPANICFIREGQWWGECGEEETRMWHDSMDPVVDDWVAFLGGRPDTGCISIRDCRELDFETGKDLPGRSQVGYLLSLGHIEKAAREQHSHLAVRNTFVKLFERPAYTPQLSAWVELHIASPGGMDVEYVNCAPDTSFLRFFEPVEVVEAATS